MKIPSETVSNSKEPETVSNSLVTITDPFSRPRIVKENSSAPTETPDSEAQSCLVASQESLSISGKGSGLGILIGYAQEGDISNITFESSSPKDVTATPDSSNGKQSNRASFIIKSISENKGLFTITFSSPCGKKEIQVKVR